MKKIRITATLKFNKKIKKIFVEHGTKVAEALRKVIYKVKNIIGIKINYRPVGKRLKSVSMDIFTKMRDGDIRAIMTCAEGLSIVNCAGWTVASLKEIKAAVREAFGSACAA